MNVSRSLIVRSDVFADALHGFNVNFIFIFKNVTVV